MNVTGWSALSLWTISLGLGMCFLFFTKIKIYLLKMKIVCFFLAAGVQTKECPSTYWAHAFEFGENMRVFTKASIHEANFYCFTCLTLLSDDQSRVILTLQWFFFPFCQAHMCTIQEPSSWKSFQERFWRKIDFSPTGKVVVVVIT